MISFRQHVVTIVAVFLALALGLLAGSAFIQPRLVESLRTDVERQVDQIDELRRLVSEVRTTVTDLRGFVDAARPYLTQGRLLGSQVVVIAQEGVEDAVTAQTLSALDEAGADVVALSARTQLAAEDPATQAELAEILGVPDADPADLPSEAATALAQRLADGAPRSPDEPDLLAELLNAGYLAPIGSGVTDAAIAEIGAPDQTVVVLAGGPAEEPVLLPASFAVPLARTLAALGPSVAAGESTDSAVQFVEDLRGTGPELVTVDDLESAMGGAALVLGLEGLIVDGQGGDYGVKGGVEPLPPA